MDPFWQYPDIDPVAISIGPFGIHWYALSYMAGLGLAWWALAGRIKAGTLTRDKWNEAQLSDLLFYSVLGIILGGRLGYVFFYGLEQAMEDPLWVFTIWKGGMSFHGGMLGVFVAMYVYGRFNGRTFFEVTDFIAPSVPLGLGCGRLGNFVNAELPGRITDVPWAVIYPGGEFPRHPSSLYQFALEGPVLFAILWWFSAKDRPRMAVSGLFLLGYGMFRFLTEFFREPDRHIGFVAFDWLTMGQLLSTPMILFGGAFLIYSYSRNRHKAGK